MFIRNVLFSILFDFSDAHITKVSQVYRCSVNWKAKRCGFVVYEGTGVTPWHEGKKKKSRIYVVALMAMNNCRILKL